MGVGPPVTGRVPHGWSARHPVGTHKSHPLQGSSCLSALCGPHTPAVLGPARCLALRPQPVTAGWPPSRRPLLSAPAPPSMLLSPAVPSPLRVQGLRTAGGASRRPLSALRAQAGAGVHTALWPLFGWWSVLPVALGLGARVDPAPAPCRMWRVPRPSGWEAGPLLLEASVWSP